MRNTSGIYGDITGHPFEFLFFFSGGFLRKKKGLSEEVISELRMTLKSRQIDQVYEQWSSIVGEDVVDDARHRLYKKPPFTDDTTMTIATMDAIIQVNGDPESVDDLGAVFKRSYYDWANKYPQTGFGGMFRDWFNKPFDQALPYGSFGNGSAMRIGPIGYISNLDTLETWVVASCSPSHNHPEGIRGAMAVAEVVMMGRFREIVMPLTSAREQIKEWIQEKYGYDLSRSYGEIREGYGFDATCQGSVPESISCFLESDSIEDAVRRAIALGGDADTQAMMAGYMAESFEKNVPRHIVEVVHSSLPEEMLEIIERYNKLIF